MTVSELMILLKKQDPNAVVVIDGKVVEGVSVSVGRLKAGYGQQQWASHENGRITAVQFTYQVEGSDGGWSDQVF